jgi:hypothetical protein
MPQVAGLPTGSGPGGPRVVRPDGVRGRWHGDAFAGAADHHRAADSCHYADGFTFERRLEATTTR